MKRILFGMVGAALAWSIGSAHADELVLGGGDVVKISVYGNPDLAVDTRVSESGFITMPLVGQVGVAGLSTAAAETKIASMLQRGGFVKNPQVNLLITALTSHPIHVGGEQVSAEVYDRARLRAGDVLRGPAIVTEMDSTTLVLPGHAATVHASGSLLINPLEG